MSLDQLDVVDAIGVDKVSDAVVLSIIDYWPWHDTESHLNTLRDKIKRYLDYIDSGEIYESYPDARGKSISIDVVAQHSFPAEAIKFLDSIALALQDAVRLSYRHVP